MSEKTVKENKMYKLKFDKSNGGRTSKYGYGLVVEDNALEYSRIFIEVKDDDDEYEKALNVANLVVKSWNTYSDDATFEEAVRPLMRYLNNKHHPHTTVIVTSTTSELVEGLESFNTDDYLKD